MPYPRPARRVAMSFGAVLLVASMTGCGGTGTPTPAGTPTAKPTLPPITPTPTAIPGGIFIDSTADLGAISPYVYGSNFGPWLAVTPTQQPFVEQAKIRFLTWPGGNWGDENDITEAQVDGFIAMCRQLGAEPRIVVRLKDGTAQKAADLVKYVNVTKGYKVTYWGIGNETDLYPVNAANGGSERYKNYDAKTYADEWRAFAVEMRKVDSSIKLIGPDVSQFTGDPAQDPYTQARADWLKAFLKADGDLVDIVSIHRYPFGQTQPTIADLQGNSKEWDDIIPSLRKLIRDATGRDLPVAVTELNSSWSTNFGGEATLDSHYNAIWFGDVLGRLIRQRVDIVTQFALTGQYAVVDKYAPWPIWNVYMMYQHFGNELVRATSDDPLVSVFAAKTSDGALTIMLVNLGTSEATKHLQIAGLDASSAETWQFFKDHQAAQGAATPLAGQVTLPPESMTLLIVKK